MDSDQTYRQQQLEKQARLLQHLGNAKRLLICDILARGDRDVTRLAREVGLSQSSLSQHLARLRSSRYRQSTKRGSVPLLFVRP